MSTHADDLMDMEESGFVEEFRRTGSNSALAAGSIALDVDKLSTDALFRSFAKRLREMQQDMPDEFKQVVEDHFTDLLA